jgi:hypothetical protein
MATVVDAWLISTVVDEWLTSTVLQPLLTLTATSTRPTVLDQPSVFPQKQR